MIQRPQTVYALTAVILAAVAPFTAVTDRFASDPQAWWLPIWWASLLTAAVTGGYATVLFKDRVRQAAWFHRAFLFSLPASGMAAGLTLSMVLSTAPVEENGSERLSHPASASPYGRHGVACCPMRPRSVPWIASADV